MRRDRWWVEPLWTGVGFLIFVIYSTWCGLQGEHYFYGGYLSPMYSPLLFTDPSVPGAGPVEHAWFDRKFYYRAYFLSPPACAVGAVPQRNYRGETFLLIFQNLHRYTLYIAIFYILVLSYDAYMAFWRDGRFGIGVGTLVLVINPIMLATYTFGCHSFRHLVGGQLNCFSCDAQSNTRHGIWKGVSWLNARHMRFAWFSLVWVGFTDLYVRLVSMGYIRDLSTWG
jgi:hypothetical protein